MNLQDLCDRCRARLLLAPRPFFEGAPYLALSFLVGAFPPVRLLGAQQAVDFALGVLGGVSLIPVVLPRGTRTGIQGWMKAWGLGMLLSAVAIDGTQGFLEGIRDGSGRGGVQAAMALNPWLHFFLLLLMGLVLGASFYRMGLHRQEAERQKELAVRASQAALRAKLAPHFIFNTLNTLHAQIEDDPRGAQLTTERLADVLRQVIAASDQPTISLKQELAFVEAYLGLEQARLGDRLKVSIDLPEELESAEVPPLSLQVLVENAVKHGVAPLEQGGEVRIGAARADGALQLWVEDPGTGLSDRRGTGTALDTLRQRLARPEDLTLERTDTGFRVAFRWRQP